MELTIYTKNTVEKTYKILKKLLITNRANTYFIKKLRNDFTMHPTQQYCTEYNPIPGILGGKLHDNYVEHEITHEGAYDLNNNE